jgi:magnesium transporter
MPRLVKGKSRKAGLAPGTLNGDGKNAHEKVELYLMHYNAEVLEEKEIGNIEEGFPYREKEGVTWINIDGVHKVDIIEKIGKQFNLHPLLLEDIAIGGQRPKIDDYEDHLFIVVKMLEYDDEKKEIKSEQVSFVFGENYVLSFQEEGLEGDVFNPNRERLRTNKGKIRKSGPDYLIYSLIDTIVDNYFIILEKISERLEEMELKLISEPSPTLLQSIYKLKREIIYLRKSVWPLREVISRLERDDSPLIKDNTRIYIRDVYDHTIQVIDNMESYRDIISGMIDIYLSSISNKMNSIIKVLTMISTIFIPLTFIVGVYGMNFRFFPELEWKYSYFVVWGVMISIAVAMLFYFRKRKWL